LVCPACHLLVMTIMAGRFESGLTLHSHHCASCTVIHGRILGYHAAHFQVSKAFGIISGYVNLPFIETAWNMKLLFWLIHEAHSSPLPRTCKWAQWLCLRISGNPQSSSSLPHAQPGALHIGHLQMQRIQVRKLPPILTVSPILIHSHSQCLLFTINYNLKEP
jgi:hypothetical protein